MALVAGLAFTANAQKSAVKFGVKAGVNLAELAVTGTEVDPEYKKGKMSNPSFYIGGNVEIPVGKTFAIQPGISLIGKGGRFKITGSDEDIVITEDSRVSVMYLEIPVNAVAKFPVGGGNVFVGAGPYFGYAISGKNKFEGTAVVGGVETTESETDDIEFGSSVEDDFKRTDFGVNFMLGYQLKMGLNIHAGYGLGLKNIANAPEENSKGTNRGISFGLGFSF